MHNTTNPTNTTKNQRMAKGIRDIATLLESLPENSPNAYVYDNEVHFYTTTVDDMVELRTLIGGKFDKLPNNNFFYLMKTTPTYKVVIFANRDNVCEKVKVGTKKVMDYDKSLPMVEVEEDVYEWVCPEVLR